MRLPVWLVSTSLILFSICSNGQNETEPKQQPAGNSVSVFGAKLHYVDAGSGSVVVLLHGLADDVGVWGSVMPALAAKHRVIALDQVGFGRSDKPLLDYRAATFVDFLDGFLNELKIDRASLVGNSLGGWIAADFDSILRGEDVLDGRVGAIHKPTLILWGREDKLIPLKLAERFHKEIAGSRLEIIDNCGHMQHVECPKEFAAAVLEFLNDLK